jgi:hypothetical protein
MAEGSGSSYLCWYSRIFYKPICPTLAHSLGIEQILVIVRKECVLVWAEEELERTNKMNTLQKTKNLGVFFALNLKSNKSYMEREVTKKIINLHSHILHYSRGCRRLVWGRGGGPHRGPASSQLRSAISHVCSLELVRGGVLGEIYLNVSACRNEVCHQQHRIGIKAFLRLARHSLDGTWFPLVSHQGSKIHERWFSRSHWCHMIVPFGIEGPYRCVCQICKIRAVFIGVLDCSGQTLPPGA